MARFVTVGVVFGATVVHARASTCPAGNGKPNDGCSIGNKGLLKDKAHADLIFKKEGDTQDYTLNACTDTDNFLVGKYTADCNALVTKDRDAGWKKDKFATLECVSNTKSDTGDVLRFTKCEDNTSKNKNVVTDYTMYEGGAHHVRYSAFNQRAAKPVLRGAAVKALDVDADPQEE